MCADVDEYNPGSYQADVVLGIVGPDGCGTRVAVASDTSVNVIELKDDADRVIPGFKVVNNIDGSSLYAATAKPCQGKFPFTADGSKQATAESALKAFQGSLELIGPRG